VPETESIRENKSQEYRRGWGAKPWPLALQPSALAIRPPWIFISSFRHWWWRRTNVKRFLGQVALSMSPHVISNAVGNSAYTGLYGRPQQTTRDDTTKRSENMIAVCGRLSSFDDSTVPSRHGTGWNTGSKVWPGLSPGFASSLLYVRHLCRCILVTINTQPSTSSQQQQQQRHKKSPYCFCSIAKLFPSRFDHV